MEGRCRHNIEDNHSRLLKIATRANAPRYLIDPLINPGERHKAGTLSGSATKYFTGSKRMKLGLEVQHSENAAEAP